MIFRWATCLTLVVVSVAIVSGCAKHKLYGSQFESGYKYCTGTPGQFNVVLARSETDLSLYSLQLQPQDITGAAGTRYHIAIANSQNNPPYRDIALRTTFTRGQTLNLGEYSREDIKLYPSIVIAKSTDANSDQANFLNNASAGGLICEIPTLDNETQYPL